MCLAIPGQIIEFLPQLNDLALVDVNGVKRNVNIGILQDEELKPGDWVLIHVGFAMAKMNEAEAKSALDFLEQLGNAFTEELEAMEGSQTD